MRRKLIYALLIVIAAFAWMSGNAWFDARRDAPLLVARADELIENGQGWQVMGDDRRKWLLQVEDPYFTTHIGIDLTSPGAGATTITQSLAKRLAFDGFNPGINKIRQTAYAISLERQLSKDQIFALFLDTAQMGSGADGWIEGFTTAAKEMFDGTPANISDEQFLTLVAVLISPGELSLDPAHPETSIRINRIKNLIAKGCVAVDHSDVWLKACDEPSQES